MGDVGRGIKSFKKGMAEDDATASGAPIEADTITKDAPKTC
jgi:Sec-independent protein translocase protein TatA